MSLSKYITVDKLTMGWPNASIIQEMREGLEKEPEGLNWRLVSVIRTKQDTYIIYFEGERA